MFKTINGDLTVLGHTLLSVNKGINNTIKASNLQIASFDKLGLKLDSYNKKYVGNAALQERLRSRSPKNTFTSYVQSLGTDESATREGYDQFLAKTAHGYDGCSKAIENFNAMQEKGVEQQNAYAHAIGTGNSHLGQYLTNLEGGTATIGGYVKYLVKAKVATIGLQAASIALNMALSMGVSMAIQAVISGISYLIHRNEKLIESANEVTNAYREQSKTLNDNVNSLQNQKDEFNRLSKGVDDYGNNISLTSDEYDGYKSIVSEILGYTPELIAGYDEEGNAIAKKNGLIEQSIALMKEEQRQKLKDQTSNENTKTIFKGAKADYNDEVSSYENSVGRTIGITNSMYGNGNEILSNITGAQLRHGSNRADNINILKEYLKEHKDVLLSNIGDIYSEFVKSGYSDDAAQNYIDWLKDTLDKIDDIEKKSHGMDDQFSLYAQKSDYYEKLTDAQKNFVNEYIKATGSIVDAEGNFLSADKIQEKADGFTDFVNELVTNEKFDEAKDKMNDLFSLDKSKLSAYDYEQQVNAILDYLVEKIDGFSEDDANKIKISLGFEFLSDGSTRVGTLIDDVKGKLKDEFKGKVDNMTLEDLVDASKLEIPEGTLLTWDEFIEKMAEAKATANTFSLDSFNKSIDDIQSAYDTLTKAKDEWNKNGSYSLDTVQALLALEPKYLAMLVNENGQLKLNEQAMYDLINAQLEEAKSKIYQNGINQLNALISEKTGEASKEAAQDKANSVIDINAETEALGLNTEAKLQNVAATARSKGVSDDEIQKIVDETIRQANAIQSAVDGMAIDFGGIVGGFSDAKDKLHELDKKISLENLKNEIEKCSLAIEKLDKDISNLDLAIDFLDDNDYAGRADLLALKLQLLTNKGASLKAEFEQLANTTPHSADEAEAIASRLSTIGDALRSNLKDWVEYTKELEQNKVQALVDSITDVDTDKISEIGDVFDAEIKKIENAIKRLNGETLFGDVSFFSAIMPEKPKESNSEKQKNNHSEQIAELQKYEDRVYAIQKQALDMQYAENQAAWTKERQELTNSLSGQEQELRKAKNTALNTQDKYNQESEKKTKEFSQNTKNVVTDLNTWMGKNPISAPLLDTSKWEGLVKNAENYAKRVKDAFNTPPISASAKEAVTNARQYLGTPYVWGGETTSGWDCSGFVNYIYGGENVTGGRTTQVQWASNNGTRITDLSQLQDGDVIYFRKSQGSDDISHVAIYTGNGKMIHAKGKDYGTVEEEISPTYWRRMIGAKRFYAKGTKDFSDINGWAGENNKPELLIDKNTGKITRITSLTPINTNKVDVIGEDDTARIEKGLPSYATGTVDPIDIAKYIRTNYPEITNAAIAGILGNIYAESNFDQFAKTSEAYGSGSNRQVTRWGLFQLDDERIPNWSNIVASGNWQKQIDTVLAEGRYQNSGMGNSQKHNMWQYITDTSLSASDIASLWDKLYERSDGSTRSKRMSKAEEFYANGLANNFDFSDTTTRVANKLATETVNKYQQYVDQVAKRYSPSSESISENIDYFKNDEFRQAKINEYKEKFEANPQSLNDYIQAIEYANKATAQSTIEFYDAETKVIMETADKYKTAHKELQEAYTQVGQGLQDAINNGESQEKIDAYYDELKQIVEATQDLESKMESVDSQWQSMIDSIVEFHKTVTDRHILEFNPEQWYADKDLEEAELNYSRQNRYTTQIETLNEVNTALETQIKLHSRLMGSITDEANKVRNEYSELYSIFISEEIEEWFNPDGSLSENYNQVLELYANNPEVLTLIKEFGQALSYNKTQYIQYQDEQKKFIDQVYDNQRTLHQHQLDMAMQVAENIQGVHNKIIASLQKEEDLLNRQLNNTSKFSQKQGISENLLDNYRAQQQEQYNSKAEYENKLKALMARSEYADIISKFDTSKWLNTNGELTAYYYSDLDNKSLISSVDEWETAKGLGELMSKWSTAISASETAILDLNDSIKSVTDDMYQQQIDAVNTAIDTVVQMIEKRKERELKALEQVHNKRIEQLQEESEFIQEAYNRATSLLDDIKSEEDYEKQLSDEQKVADNLQAQIAEYSLDDSDGAKQRVLELQKQLNEQLEKIDDLKREHEYEQTKKALNDDLEAYNKYWDEIQESEDDQYQHNQELIEARYTEEAKYHEAIRVLQSGTFDDFTSKGVYAYETIYSKGNQVALDLTDAYDSFATETGTKFQNLGLEFKNITALLEHNIELIDIFNSKAQEWNVDTNTTYTDHTGNDYYNNITKPNNSSLGRDEGVAKNYTVYNNTSSNKASSGNVESLTPSQQTIVNKMIANSQKWGQIMSTGLSYDELPENTKSGLKKLHTDNDNLAKELAKSLRLKYGSTDGLWYDGDDGTWYRRDINGKPIPLYHTGRISKESQQAFNIINDTLKPNEEVAIVKTNENIITMEQMQEWAKNISLHTPSLSSIPNSVSHGLRALDKSMHSATNNLESNIDNSKHLNIEKISIGANNAVTKSDVKNGVFGAMKEAEKSH